MNKTIFLKEGYVKVNYKPDTQVLYVRWKNLFDQDIVSECCQKQLEQVRKGARIMVVDISKANGVLSNETQKWFGNELFPDLAAAGLKAIITIDSTIPVTRLSSTKWAKTGSKFSFDMVTVQSIEEATKVILEYTTRKQPAAAPIKRFAESSC